MAGLWFAGNASGAGRLSTARSNSSTCTPPRAAATRPACSPSPPTCTTTTSVASVVATAFFLLICLLCPVLGFAPQAFLASVTHYIIVRTALQLIIRYNRSAYQSELYFSCMYENRLLPRAQLTLKCFIRIICCIKPLHCFNNCHHF